MVQRRLFTGERRQHPAPALHACSSTRQQRSKLKAIRCKLPS
jgi:hypothetical protein